MRPGWVEVLFKRRTAAQALRTGFLLNLEQDFLRDEAEAHPSGREILRSAALEKLDAAPDDIALALVILSAVGKPEDLPQTDPFLDHPNEGVQKAAKACRFKLRRARS